MEPTRLWEQREPGSFDSPPLERLDGRFQEAWNRHDMEAFGALFVRMQTSSTLPEFAGRVEKLSSSTTHFCMESSRWTRRA